MPTLTAQQVAALVIQVGFPQDSLAIMVAIAHAESGFRTDAVGDKNLTQQGECSVGLWQINYRPSRDATGGPRDPTLNLDPVHNAQAALMISNRGRYFVPWSTYSSGAYRTFLNDAQAAVNAALTATKVEVPMPDNVYPALAPVVALVPTSTDKGYWLVCSDGEVFAFGDATYLGRVTAPPKA